MTLLRYILPALAITGSAYGQCSVKGGGTTTIANAAEATAALQGCGQFRGSIELAHSISGDIDLGAVETITGSLIGKNVSQLTSLTSGFLTTVTENFMLSGLTNVNTLSFPELSKVYNLEWDNFGQNVQQLPFTNLAQVNTISITNTFFQNLDGININRAATLIFANNNYLSEVNLPITNITDRLILNANGNGLTASFPQLSYVDQMQLSNCSSISLPKLNLTAQTGGLYFIGNSITTLSLPKLLYAGLLTVNGNADLKSIDVPKLATVNGAININNNSALTGTIDFPVLKQVKGNMNFVGDYSNVEIPNLATALAGMNLVSTKNIQSVCNHYSAISGRGATIQGSVSCTSKASKSQALPSAVSASGGSSQPSSSTNAATMYASSVASTVGVFGVLAAMMELLM